MLGPSLRGSLAIALSLLLAGCAYYSTTSRGRSLTGTVAVPFLNNRTTQPDLEITATEVLIEALDNDGNLRVVSLGSEEYLLTGAVTRYSEEPFSINPEGRSEEYKLSIVVVLTFTDQVTGEELWRDKRFTGTESFFLEGSATGEGLSREEAEKKVLEYIIEDILNAVFGEW